MTRTMTDDQKTVAKGILGAVIFSTLYALAGWAVVSFDGAGIATLAERMVFVIRCQVFALPVLIVGIVNVVRERFFNRGWIDGSPGDAGCRLDINKRFIQNTVEQLVLAVMANVALVVVLPQSALKCIPLLVSLFIVGRLIFWASYLRNPVSRAFGFTVTFFPTVCVVLYVMWQFAAGPISTA